MLSEAGKHAGKLAKIPVGLRILIGVLAWLFLISWLHWRVNFDHGGQRVIKMGYMPVITNLACPLLAEAARGREDLRFEAVKFASFADMGEALRAGDIQVAFMIAPLSIVLRQQGEDLRVVYIGNRHESTLVVKKDGGVEKFSDLAGKTLAVPMRYSGHYLAAREMAQKAGINSRIKILEMNPPDMSSAMTAGALDAYFVGEPFAAQAVLSGHARELLPVREIWPGFICNLMLMQGEFIDENRRLAGNIVQWAIRSGVWAKNHPQEAAAIAADYWNQSQDLVFHALTTPPDRIEYGRYLPKEEELQDLASRMKRFGLLESDSVDGLVYDQLAKDADVSGVTDFQSITKTP